MSDTNRVALRFVDEGASLGTTPATPAFRDLPFTGSPNLGFVPETVISNLMRADRQVSDLILVGGVGAGDANSELAFFIHDVMIEAAFYSTWQVRSKWRNDDGATQITNVDGTGNDYEVTDEGFTVVVDDIVFAEGFNASLGNNGFKIVIGAPTNTSIPVAALVDETPPTGARLAHVGRQAATSDIVATAAPDGLTSTVLDFTTLGLADGDWIKIAGFSTATQDNDFVRIQAGGISANALLFDRVPATWAADGGSGDTVQLYFGESIINGILRRSFTLEREYTDHSPVTFEYLRGMLLDGMALSAASQSIVTLNHTFAGLGKNQTDPTFQDTGRFTGATTIPSVRANVLNSSSNVARMARGGSQIVGKNFITEFGLTIANNARAKPAVGFLGPADYGTGEFNVTGALSSYFDDKSVAVDVVANTETSVDTRFLDSQGHILLIDVPRLKYTEGAPEVPGKNDDVVINPGFQAILDEALGYTLKFQRFYGVQ